MNDKICLVTGASSGIGRATALGLAGMGATVLMACRNIERSRSVKESIQRDTRNPNVHLLAVDLASQASVRGMVTELRANYQNLHVLVNNAGTYYTKRHITEDGLEMTFAVNYLSRFLMTNLLLDALKSSAPSRVIEVAGAYHAKGHIDLDDLQLERGYTGTRANNASKLANVLFTYELSRRLEGTGVTVNCLHPGTVRTDLIRKDRDYPRFSLLIYRLLSPFFKPPEKGADTVLYLASSPEVEGVTGKYFVNRKARQTSPASYDVELARRLWEVSLGLTGLR